jgi:hypothetical protein
MTQVTGYTALMKEQIAVMNKTQLTSAEIELIRRLSNLDKRFIEIGDYYGHIKI